MTKIELTGVHKVRKKLSDGKYVQYHRTHRGKGGITFWKSTDKCRAGSADYLHAYQAALGMEKQDNGKFREVINAYLESPKFKKLAPRTQKDIKVSIFHTKGIDKEFGEMPREAFEDPRIRRRVISWRDKKWGLTRQADMKTGNLVSIVAWATNNGHLHANHLQRIDKVYKNDRSKIIWTDADIKKFCSEPVPRYVQRILIVVSETGLAPVDARRLCVSEHVKKTPKGRRIEMYRAKTKQIVSMPITRKMAEVLDEMEQGQDYVLVTKSGKQWGHENNLGSVIGDWKRGIGLRDELHLYDARGTAATRLLNAGLEISEIALSMGWSIDTASKMISVYAKVNPNITDGILKKIQAAESGNTLESV